MKKQTKGKLAGLDQLAPVIFGLPWLEIIAELWRIARRLWRGMADEGIYEVLEHEATLELKDVRGESAEIRKRQKVRYLQNGVMAFQDQAWGDGEILKGYRCSPGKVVDRWRPGGKTYLLISLRETKRRGEIDDYLISWKAKGGYVRSRELWESEINHRTRQLKIAVIFPRARFPKKTWRIEALRRKRQVLGEQARLRLPDERLLVFWEVSKPRLNERYQLEWEW